MFFFSLPSSDCARTVFACSTLSQLSVFSVYKHVGLILGNVVMSCFIKELKRLLHNRTLYLQLYFLQLYIYILIHPFASTAAFKIVLWLMQYVIDSIKEDVLCVILWYYDIAPWRMSAPGSLWEATCRGMWRSRPELRIWISWGRLQKAWDVQAPCWNSGTSSSHHHKEADSSFEASRQELTNNTCNDHWLPDLTLLSTSYAAHVKLSASSLTIFWFRKLGGSCPYILASVGSLSPKLILFTPKFHLWMVAVSCDTQYII